MTCEDLFLTQLRRRGFRFTPQRRAILQALHANQTPQAADVIFQQASALTAGINRSTVYRTLEMLAEMGFISVIETAEDQRQYLLLAGEEPHIHLVCQSCGRVFPVNLSKHDSLVRHLWEEHHFKVNLSTFTISGTCRDCLEQGRAVDNPC